MMGIVGINKWDMQKRDDECEDAVCSEVVDGIYIWHENAYVRKIYILVHHLRTKPYRSPNNLRRHQNTADPPLQAYDLFKKYIYYSEDLEIMKQCNLSTSSVIEIIVPLPRKRSRAIIYISWTRQRLNIFSSLEDDYFSTWQKKHSRTWWPLQPFLGRKAVLVKTWEILST